jgi:hypothetical protein
MVSFAELKFLASLRTLEPNGAFPQKMLKMFGLTFFEKKITNIMLNSILFSRKKILFKFSAKTISMFFIFGYNTQYVFVFFFGDNSEEVYSGICDQH